MKFFEKGGVRIRYEEVGKAIVEDGKVGDWYLFRGKLVNGWRNLVVDKVRRLSD